MKKENYKWSENDVDFLKNNIGTLTFKGIAKRLGRTESAVIVKAKRLKLGTYTSNSEFCTIGEACELLGVTRPILMKKVRKGKLKPLRKNIRGGAYRMFFRYEELEEFKKAYAKPAPKKMDCL